MPRPHLAKARPGFADDNLQGGGPRRSLGTVAWALVAVLAGTVVGAENASELSPAPSPGFVALFNGKDLSGWRGLGHFNPRRLAAMSDEQRAAKQRADNENLHKHWKVEDGEIVNDGHGVYLTTEQDYGDFELRLDWKMVQPRGDSGVYLRGCPQVQIWDPGNPNEKHNGADQGSGGLWNNNPGSKGRFPRVLADNPIGQWNHLRIRLVGERVTVHLNGRLVVDDAVMHNFFDRKSPLFPRGPIQLQTHGSEMRFRNIFLREIPPTTGE